MTVTGVHHPLSLSMETHPALLGPSCSFIGSSQSPTYQPPNQVQAPMPFQFQSPLTQFQFPTYSSQSTIGQNTNLFYLKKLSGNICICQGYRGSLILRLHWPQPFRASTVRLWHRAELASGRAFTLQVYNRAKTIIIQLLGRRLPESASRDN